MKITRRDFATAAAIIPALRVRRALAAQPVSSGASSTEADVLIVGAGMAGISAARYLRARGYTVIVLEARDRLGGRIWTDRSWEDGLPLDLGASWIHGATAANPLMRLASSYGLRTIRTDDDKEAIYTDSGTRVSDRERRLLTNLFDDLFEDIDDYREEREDEDEPDMALGQAVERIVRRYELSPDEQRLLEYALVVEVEHDYGDDLGRLSLYEWDQDEEFDGDDVLFPRGYDELVVRLARGVDVRLGHLVSRVDYGTRGVTITTERGTFKGRYGVVTLPLGVLQSGSVRFTPGLPAKKLSAIAKLAMGVLDKVYFRFAESVWPGGMHWLGHVSDREGEWSEFLNLVPSTGQPVLMALNSGSFARRIESWSDDRIVDQGMAALRRMFGASMPDPSAVKITRWASDPLARGSYSHIPAGATGSHYDQMAAPVGDRLFFAGEATSREYPQTVHGAFLSGEREARRILALSGRLNW